MSHCCTDKRTHAYAQDPRDTLYASTPKNNLGDFIAGEENDLWLRFSCIIVSDIQ